MAQFKKGDVVELKSGGPKMTVDDVTEAGMVKCIWFEKSAKYEDFSANTFCKNISAMG